jgi:hypothetical protein
MNTKLANECLVIARALIDAPERWTKGKYRDCDPITGHVKCRCAMGAVYSASEAFPRTTSFDAVELAEQALIEAIPEGFLRGVEAYNDEATHAEVLALFDRAIAVTQAAA